MQSAVYEQEEYGAALTELSGSWLIRCDCGVGVFTSLCFASSGEASGVFVARSGGTKVKLTEELILYARSMQAVGALVHAAIGRGEIKVVDGGARKMEEALRAYYRELGVHEMDLGSVRTMARELVIWRAAEVLLKGGTMGRELVEGEDVCVVLICAGGTTHSLQQVCLGRPRPPRALFPCGTGRRGPQAGRAVRLSWKAREVPCVLL